MITSWIPSMPVALGDRRGFPSLESRAYVAHCAISPVSTGVQQAVNMVLDDYARAGVAAFLGWHERREGLRACVARLLGASPEDIGYVANTTTGISTIASCFPWQSDDTILVFRGEFPTNVTPWQQAAKRHGLRIEFHDVAEFSGPRGVGLDRLEQRLRRGDVRMVAVSLVQFQTGLRMPVEAMSRLAHEHGAQLCCDAIQAVGAQKVDVQTLGVDYLVAGSHKWMMGLEGSAIVYVAPHRVAALHPFTAGWLSHEDPVEFLFAPGKLDYDRPIRGRANFVEAGAYPVMQLAALQTSLSYIEHLGTDAIEAHIDRYLAPIDRAARELGFQSSRSEVPAQRSSILALTPPNGLAATTVVESLAAQRIVATAPDGFVRIAPHWPNALAETDLVIEALGHAVRGDLLA